MPPKRAQKKKAAASPELTDTVDVELEVPDPDDAKPKKSNKRGKKTEGEGDAGKSKKSKTQEAAKDAEVAPKPKLKKKASSRESIPAIDSSTFTSSAKTTDGKPWNVKIASWNVNGIRAWIEKNGQSYIPAENPDVFCVGETKCQDADIPDEATIPGYHKFFSSAEVPGYAGTALYSKTEPISVAYGLGIKKHDNEGRVITAEFEKFYVIIAYVPNAGKGLPRLAYRTKEWDRDFMAYLQNLDQKKPVILCGDLNVAHLDIDLKNPKTNKKTAGFTTEERAGMTALLEAGFVDSFRHLYPEQEEAYTFWTYMMNARGKNVGWRLDYFIISERLTANLCDNLIRSDVMGSDHCPIVLLLAM